MPPTAALDSGNATLRPSRRPTNKRSGNDGAALLLVIKARVEALEAGITTLEHEFPANMVLPDNSTVSDGLTPRLHEAVAEGRVLLMLPPGRA